MSAKVNPKDFSVKTKWEEQAAAADVKQAKVDTVQRRLFNPAKLTEQVNAIHEEEDPNLGVIRYGELSLHDAFTIEKCKSDAALSLLVFVELKKIHSHLDEV
jgi:hypothetical protein